MNIAFIPIRKGSKSIPKKNIKVFAGQPLLYWTLSAALNCERVDKVILATDSEEAKAFAKNLNQVKLSIYNRNTVNAQDTSTTESVMLEYINSMTNYQLSDSDNFILLQATSPFTCPNDISKALSMIDDGFDSVLSVVEFKRYLWSNSGPINYDYKQRMRRQEMPKSFMENGAIYINNIGNIVTHQNRLSGKIGLYVMPEYTGIEIDEPADWIIAESLFKKFNPNSFQSSNIKLVLSDVDGVLTDAGMYYSENGEELKKFNTHDGMGFELLRKRGIKTGLITSEKTMLVERRAQKLNVDYLYQGKSYSGKLEIAEIICKKEGIQLSEVAYIGDDLNCKDILTNVGFAACPINATQEIKKIPNIHVLKSKGGEGAFREFADIILYGGLLAQ